MIHLGHNSEQGYARWQNRLATNKVESTPGPDLVFDGGQRWVADAGLDRTAVRDFSPWAAST
jgi:hypothetical protein